MTEATDLAARVAALPPGMLPPGRLVSPAAGGGPVYWLTDGAPAPGEWGAWRRRSPGSGLWPVLLQPGRHTEPERPWATGEIEPAGPEDPRVSGDPDQVMAGWWREHTAFDPEHDVLSPAEREAVTAPFGSRWPGSAPALAADAARDRVDVATDVADRVAGEAPPVLATMVRRARRPLFGRRTPSPQVAAPTGNGVRLGLVAVERGADVPDAIGWSGRANVAELAGETALVLRSWEDRFGVEVVALGVDTLTLAVGTPPRTDHEALAVAAEHFAFCPDAVWQGIEPLTAYAASIEGADQWVFWWD